MLSKAEAVGIVGGDGGETHLHEEEFTELLREEFTDFSITSLSKSFLGNYFY